MEVAAREAEAARAAADDLARAATKKREALDAATTALEAAESASTEAEAALHVTQHAEMAHELRRDLTAGEPCPVCDRVVERVPRAGAAPKVAAADRALAKARTVETKARNTKEQAAAGAATALEQSAAGSERAEALAIQLVAGQDAARDAEAALATTKSELVDRLGDGDPRALLDERQHELELAETAVRAASAAADAARTRLETCRVQADETGRGLATLANQLASAWGLLGQPRPVGTAAADVRSSYVEIGETLVERLTEAAEAGDRAAAEAHAATEAVAAELAAFDLPPDADVARVVADAAAAAAASAERVRTIEETLAAGADLEARLVVATGARNVARSATVAVPRVPPGRGASRTRGPGKRAPRGADRRGIPVQR